MNSKTKFSGNWKRSAQTRKQRKFRHRAPLHLKQKMMHAHVAKALRSKHSGIRATQVRKNDKVRICRGEFKGKEGKVERVQLKYGRVYVSGMNRLKADGSKIPVWFHPSNLLVVEFDLSDVKRKTKLAEREKTPSVNPK
ncbi:50S ribosomal protein L24 [Candidatus Woesearchaeota archaeon]|nr:50S ribosomal protein L24 [Candidatus Woesearchaeota archaeon]